MWRGVGQMPGRQRILPRSPVVHFLPQRDPGIDRAKVISARAQWLEPCGPCQIRPGRYLLQSWYSSLRKPAQKFRLAHGLTLTCGRRGPSKTWSDDRFALLKGGRRFNKAVHKCTKWNSQSANSCVDDEVYCNSLVAETLA